MTSQSVFITGGAGYVGAMLVPRLLQERHHVTVLDLMIYGEDVLAEHPDLTVIKGDIRNQELLKTSIPGHDVVILPVAHGARKAERVSGAEREHQQRGRHGECTRSPRRSTANSGAQSGE